MSLLTEPFAHPFMRSALLAAVLIGLTCALLGVYVVHRRMAFVGDALAHTTLPGLAVAYLGGFSLSVGALAAGVATALLVGWAGRKRALSEDSAIGVVFTGMFALGVLLMTRGGTQRDLAHALVGNLLGVSAGDLWLMAGVLAVVAGSLLLFHKELELTTFDPAHAAAVGLSPDRMRYLLLVLLALAVVAGIRAVGVVLTSALLVTPAATASLVTRRVGSAVAVAAGLSVTATVGGLLLSYHVPQTPTGAAIVLVATGLFALAAVGRAAAGG